MKAALLVAGVCLLAGASARAAPCLSWSPNDGCVLQAAPTFQGANGLPAMVSPSTPMPTQDANSASFSDWPFVYASGVLATKAQVGSARAIEIVLSAGGTVTLTSFSGKTLALSLPAGTSQFAGVPAMIVFSNGAAGSVYTLQ